MITAVLVAAVIFQINLVMTNYGWTWAKATLRTTNLPAMKRSSRFLFGVEGSDYIDFLRAVVPDDMPVVGPEGVGGYGHQNLLQFFLLPRAIPGGPCIGAGDTSPACTEFLLARSHYVPALGEFPVSSIMEDHKELVEFDGPSGWFQGVYVPEGSVSAAPVAPQSNSIANWLRYSTTSLLVYGIVFFAGFAAVAPLIGRHWYGWPLAIAFPVGSGLITWLVFLFSWAGLPLSAMSYLLAATILCVPALIWILITGGVAKFLYVVRSWKRPKAQSVLKNPLAVAGLIVLIGILSLSVMITIGRAYSLFDGIANWALKGYAIAYEGSIFAGSRWGGHQLEYPQNLHLQIALFRMVDGDALPGSKVLFSFYFASLIGGCYVFWRSFGSRRSVALLGCLILATTPDLFVHSTIGFANLPMSVYLVLGTLIGLDGIRRSSPRMQIVASMLLGLAAWTRLEAAMYSLVIGVGLIVASRAILKYRVHVVALFAPMIVIMLPWLLFYSNYGVKGTPSAELVGRFADEGIFLGEDQILSIKHIADYLKSEARDFDSWGAIMPLFIVGAVVGLVSASAEHRRNMLSIIFMSLLALLAIGAVFYLGGVVGIKFREFLERSGDRHLIPVPILLLIVGVLGLRFAEDRNTG